MLRIALEVNVVSWSEPQNCVECHRLTSYPVIKDPFVSYYTRFHGTRMWMMFAIPNPMINQRLQLMAAFASPIDPMNVCSTAR